MIAVTAMARDAIALKNNDYNDADNGDNDDYEVVSLFHLFTAACSIITRLHRGSWSWPPDHHYY